ncbi:hypothetical protein F5Y08DRAFT_317726 [Xylaria arbuscula]|nr:hypothetical protein F5Y08DRAFT_317726 [Xylaria arbuscula]
MPMIFLPLIPEPRCRVQHSPLLLLLLLLLLLSLLPHPCLYLSLALFLQVFASFLAARQGPPYLADAQRGRHSLKIGLESPGLQGSRQPEVLF